MSDLPSTSSLSSLHPNNAGTGDHDTSASNYGDEGEDDEDVDQTNLEAGTETASTTEWLLSEPGSEVMLVPTPTFVETDFPELATATAKPSGVTPKKKRATMFMPGPGSTLQAVIYPAPSPVLVQSPAPQVPASNSPVPASLVVNAANHPASVTSPLRDDGFPPRVPNLAHASKPKAEKKRIVGVIRSLPTKSALKLELIPVDSSVEKIEASGGVDSPKSLKTKLRESVSLTSSPTTDVQEKWDEKDHTKSKEDHSDKKSISARQIVVKETKGLTQELEEDKGAAQQQQQPTPTPASASPNLPKKLIDAASSKQTLGPLKASQKSDPTSEEKGAAGADRVKGSLTVSELEIDNEQSAPRMGKNSTKKKKKFHTPEELEINELVENIEKAGKKSKNKNKEAPPFVAPPVAVGRTLKNDTGTSEFSTSVISEQPALTIDGEVQGQTDSAYPPKKKPKTRQTVNDVDEQLQEFAESDNVGCVPFDTNLDDLTRLISSLQALKSEPQLAQSVQQLLNLSVGHETGHDDFNMSIDDALESLTTTASVLYKDLETQLKNVKDDEELTTSARKAPVAPTIMERSPLLDAFGVGLNPATATCYSTDWTLKVHHVERVIRKVKEAREIRKTQTAPGTTADSKPSPTSGGPSSAFPLGPISSLSLKFCPSAVSDSDRPAGSCPQLLNLVKKARKQDEAPVIWSTKGINQVLHQQNLSAMQFLEKELGKSKAEEKFLSDRVLDLEKRTEKWAIYIHTFVGWQ